MATSTLYTGRGGRVDVEYTITQNINNNTSTITTTAYVIKTNGNFYSYVGTPRTFTLSIGASSKTYGWTFNFKNMTLNQRYAITSHSRTVTHDAAGAMANIPVSVACNTGTDGLENISGSVGLSIPTIPRATTPKLSAAVPTGETITITLPRASTAFTHSLTYTFGNASGTIATGATTSYAWVVPHSLAAQMPNSLSGSGTMTCKTYNGSSLVGTTSLTFTVRVPTFMTPTVSMSLSGVDLLAGKYVQGRSKVKVTLTDAGSNGSTIRSRTTTVTGVTTSTANTFTSGVLGNSGTVNITTQVTDSRNRVATATTSIVVEAYQPPSIEDFKAFRANADGSANPSGSYIRVTASGIVSPAGGGNAARSIVVTSRENGVGDWKTISTSTASYTPTTALTTPANPDSSFEITVRLSDFSTTFTNTINVGTGFVLMDFHKDGRGVAFGKVAEGNILFEIGGDAKVTGNFGVDGAMQSKFTPFILSERDNLNDYTDVGFYRCSHSSVAATLSNSPTILAFSMLVELSASIKQTITEYTTGQPRMYVRNGYQGTWGEWREIGTLPSGQDNTFEEYGSNTYGEYIRYGNGIQICTRTVTLNRTTTHNNQEWNMPASFVGLPAGGIAHYYGINTLYQRSCASTYLGTQSYCWNTAVMEATNVGGTLSAQLFAVGRWK